MTNMFGVVCPVFLAISSQISLMTDLLSENSSKFYRCLLYTSDAADDMQCVDLGGRRIIKKITVVCGGVCVS